MAATPAPTPSKTAAPAAAPPKSAPSKSAPAAASSPGARAPLSDAGTIICRNAFLLVRNAEEQQALCYGIPVEADGPDWKKVRYKVETWGWNGTNHQFEVTGMRSESDLVPEPEDRLFGAGPTSPGVSTQPTDPELPAIPWQSLVPKDLAVVAMKSLPGKEPRRLAAALTSRRGVEQRHAVSSLLVVELPSKGAPRTAFQWTSPPGEIVHSLDIDDLTGDGSPEVILHTRAAETDQFHLFELTGR